VNNTLNGDLVNLFIGAVIGILGSICAYAMNHLLKLREQRVLREFEIREKGRDFHHKIYGVVAVLSDYVTSFLQEDSEFF
jgi:membrane protein YqaA with SNARE-associated domain